MKIPKVLLYLLLGSFFSGINSCVFAGGMTSIVMPTYHQSLSEEDAFFSLLSRLRYINRWPISHNCEHEDLENHSYETALIAHALCIIKNVMFGGKLNAERAAVIAMFHDVPEIITADVPSPIKHSSDEIQQVYSKLETEVINDMLGLISNEKIRKEYSPLLNNSQEDKELLCMVKAADKISAIIKCLREIRLGNDDFKRALLEISEKVFELDDPAVKYFIDRFLPAYGFNLYRNS